jgi:hypothetical protein
MFRSTIVSDLTQATNGIAHHVFVRLNRAEQVNSRLGTGQGFEQGALAEVKESNDDSFHGAFKESGQIRI